MVGVGNHSLSSTPSSRYPIYRIYSSGDLVGISSLIRLTIWANDGDTIFSLVIDNCMEGQDIIEMVDNFIKKRAELVKRIDDENNDG